MSCIVSLWIVTGVAVQRQVTISSSPLGHLFEWSRASVLTEEGQIPRFVRPSTFLQTDGYDRLTPPIATFKNDLGRTRAAQLAIADAILRNSMICFLSSSRLAICHK
ncbi:predicted protein [Histoplasma capsulatum G186AR]|uniref:Uncharacterized protein n=1 Tax=Ajellomyces capsulatus (strain G186AR / H82 / ATCC MYA-2454 / RMSCC 2432) TaxID=447093 RepID=C0NMB1_AJECG|nr:uncharacterized protein HCBG_04641 [Histoplasma capsulatum G186AR]EEH07762.1 predicted protein [Histoplasma capsulatum G186AR]